MTIKDIFIPRKEAAGVKNGDKVIATITDYGSKNKPGFKKKIWEESVEISVQIFCSEFRKYQAQRVPDHVDADRDEDWTFCNIDGEDATG